MSDTGCESEMSAEPWVAEIRELREEVAGLRRGRRRSRMALVGGAVAAAALVGGGVAFAVIPDAGTGVIHGCYGDSTGALRVIDPATGSCSGSETALNWNALGINWRGAWSATASYAVGDAVAYNGSSYLALVANTTKVPQAPTWATLASGMHDRGAWSATPTYLYGSVVSYQGNSYLATKPSHDDVPTDTARWTLLAGKGDPGSDGAAVLNGMGGPADSLGRDGDFYIDTAAEVIYGPKAGGSWPASGTDLVGPKGDPGPAAVSVDSENSSIPRSAELTGVGVRVSASCSGAGSGIATLDIAGPGPFSVSGTYYANGSGVVTTTPGNVYGLSSGIGQRDDNNQSGTFEIDASSTGAVTAHLLVTSGGSVASLDVFLAGSTTAHCEARGVGVPTA